MVNPKTNVLDHGYIRLVDVMGSDLSIVRAARVSYDAEWRAGENAEGDAKLIAYLWRNGHTTPFESVTISIEVMAPIFVFRQWHRHRTQSYNELSARYRELPEKYYVPDPAMIGTQDAKNKQTRNLATTLDETPTKRTGEVEAYRLSCDAAFMMYKSLLQCGWPRELARGVLPVSTYSHMFATMNLLNCFRFLTLRLDPHAQNEIRVYAEALLDLIRPKFPVAVAAFTEVL